MEEQPRYGVLKEEMIFQKTHTTNLLDVRTLNMWGFELNDVSILARCPNVETISMPINQISTLAGFQHCQNLVNLLLRQNLISDFNEISYLQNLPHLENLSLSENPIASLPNYRSTVIRMLPHLMKLDNIDTTILDTNCSIPQKAVPPPPMPKVNAPPQPAPISSNSTFSNTYNPKDSISSYTSKDNNCLYNPKDNNATYTTKRQFNLMSKQNQKVYPEPDRENDSYFSNNANLMNKTLNMRNLVSKQQQNYHQNLIQQRAYVQAQPTYKEDLDQQHFLTAILSLIPELNVDSLQIVLESIQERVSQCTD